MYQRSGFKISSKSNDSNQVWLCVDWPDRLHESTVWARVNHPPVMLLYTILFVVLSRSFPFKSKELALTHYLFKTLYWCIFVYAGQCKLTHVYRASLLDMTGETVGCKSHNLTVCLSVFSVFFLLFICSEVSGYILYYVCDNDLKNLNSSLHLHLSNY